MALIPERIPVKRVAVLVEMADGSTVAMYAEPDPLNNDAEVEVQTHRPVLPRDWSVPGDGARRVLADQMDARITIRGLHNYRAAENMPAMIGATLDAVRNAVGA